MEDRKLLIIKKACELYLKFGIKNVTLDHISHDLGISKKTLYQFFKNKAELVSHVIDYYHENPAFNLNDFGQGNAIDRYFALREHIVSVLKFYNTNMEDELRKRYPKLYRKMHKQKREKIYINTVENLKEGIKTGLYRADLDVDVAARLQVGQMLLTLNPANGLFTTNELSNINLFDKVLESYMYSICTDKGKKYFHKQLNKIKE